MHLTQCQCLAALLYVIQSVSGHWKQAYLNGSLESFDHFMIKDDAMSKEILKA